MRTIIDMTTAIRTDSVIQPPISHQSLIDGLQTAFGNAGFPLPVDAFGYQANNSSDDGGIFDPGNQTSFSAEQAYNLVYPCILDETKARGITYNKIKVSAYLEIQHCLCSTWDTENHLSHNCGALRYSFTPSANNPVKFISLNGQEEYKIVIIWQGSNYFPLGYVAPLYKAAWWDLDLWNYAFILDNNSFLSAGSCSVNPYENETFSTSLGNYFLAQPNQVTNERDVIPGIYFYSQTCQGTAGRTSDDWVSVAASGTNKFDVIETESNGGRYLLLSPNHGGLAIKFTT